MLLVAACAAPSAPTATAPTATPSTATPPTTSPFPIETIAVGETRLDVWVADEGEERSQGLMGVEELPEGIDGMLFVFETLHPAGFHMRNTLMELDIWWFDGDMILVGTTQMEPCTEEPCLTYQSPGDIQWALETPRGKSDFEPGDRLSIVGND